MIKIITKSQRKWLHSMAAHREFCAGPGRKMRAVFLEMKWIEENKEGFVKLTDNGLRALVSPMYYK